MRGLVLVMGLGGLALKAPVGAVTAAVTADFQAVLLVLLQRRLEAQVIAEGSERC